MRQIIFVKDNINKHSIRALVAAFEKHFPDREYFIFNHKTVLENLYDNSLVLFSSASRSIDIYISLAGEIKRLKKNINTIIGGSHATAMQGILLENFDAVFLREGEVTLKDIILKADSDKVEGVIVGEQISNLNDFKVFPRKIISLGPIEIIRGCPSRCNFCQTPNLFPGKLRYRSVDFIVSEIEFALSRKGYADARFIAPDASSYYYNKGVNLEAIALLLSSIKSTLRNNGKIFYGTFPSELDPSGVSDELADLLTTYCDNKLIVLGLQSASDKMTKLMKRRSGVAETERAINILLKHNFEIVVDLIFGLPYEDEFTYNETLKFINRWKGKITIHSHPYDRLPGSKWENATPTDVPDELIRSVKSLEGIGRVFGKMQEEDKNLDRCCKKI